VAARSEFPWKLVAIVLGVLLGLLVLRWLASLVWWLFGVLAFVAVVGAIVWALFTVTRKR
jgi:hypothetical protein